MNTVDFLRKIQRSKVATKSLRFLSKKIGENFYEREWDLLIILDATQYRIICDVASDYKYIDSINRIKSRGSHSSEWCYNTFVRDFDKYKNQIERTHYITGNVIASLVLNGASDTDFLDDKGRVEEAANQDYGHERIDNLRSYVPAWKGSLNMDCDHIPPQLITDKFLHELSDSQEDHKYMLHYMQPHEPFVEADSDRTSGWPNSREEISMFNMSKEDYDEILKNYRKNHRYILDHLRVLLNEIDNDMKVAISADHGNITKEVLGVRYTFGHPNYVFFSKQLRSVPWIEVDQSKATKPNRSWDNLEVSNSDHTSEEVIDRLESLGYK